MKNLSLTRLSTTLTPRERAKLVVSYQLKAFQNLNEADFQKYKSGEADDIQLSGDAEVRQILAGCPPEQGREYNFYISLKQQVWQKVVPGIHDQLMSLTILEASLANIKQLLRMAPFIHSAVEELERIPVVVSKTEYDEAVIKSREYERGVVLSLEGRFNLIEQEAYALLITTENINPQGDLDSYLDYMYDFGKTEDQLVDEKMEDVLKGIAKYSKIKERCGAETRLFDYYSQFNGLDEEQLRVKIREEYSEYLNLPSKEEHEKWCQTLESQRTRLFEAIEKGELKAKENGIEAGSYYNWPNRHQKFAGEGNNTSETWNPLNEECMEIGISEGKVISSSQANTEDWKRIVVTTFHNENTLGFGGEDVGNRRKEGVIHLLKHLLPCEVSEKDFNSEERLIKLTNDDYKKLFRIFAQKARELLEGIAEGVALVKAIEEKYFDGMEIVRGTGESEIDYFSLDYFADKAKAIIEGHNQDMKNIVITFTKVSLGFWDYKLQDIDSFLVNTEVSVNQEILAKKLRVLESEAKE